MAKSKSTKQLQKVQNVQKIQNEQNVQNVQNVQNTQELVYSEHFEGPLPHPEILYRYSQIDPDIPNRIIKMVEEQSKARLENEKKELENIIELRTQHLNQESNYNNRGQLYGFLVLAIITIGSFILIFNNKPISGFSTLGTAIVGVIASVVYNNINKKGNNKE